MILLRPVWIPDELRLKRFFYALYDWSFGPTGMIGLGGTYIEVMKDGAFRAAAVDRATALETIADLRSISLSKRVPLGLRCVAVDTALEAGGGA